MGLLEFNTHRTPFADVHVRRAFAYAIDRGHSVIAQASPKTSPLYTIITPAQFATLGTPAQVHAVVKTIPTYRRNIAKAKQELALSKYPHGFSVTTDITDVYNIPQIMQAMAADVKPIGITLHVNRITSGDWLKRYETPTSTEPINWDTLGCYYPDSGQFPNLFLSSTSDDGAYPWSVFRYQNPTINKLTQAGDEETDNAKRLRIYGQDLKLAMTELPFLPITTQSTFGAITKRFSFPSFGWFGGDYWPWPLAIKAA
jgi:peptide/nickel transport system substrate-binding protein